MWVCPVGVANVPEALLKELEPMYFFSNLGHNLDVISWVPPYVTEHRKRDHLGQKTELLVPPYISCLGLSNDTFCEARSATNTKIQDTKVTPRRN